MNQWLIIGGIALLFVVGLSSLIVGMGIGRWRSLAREQSTDAVHREQVQQLQQQLKETCQKKQATAQELATALQTITQQNTKLTRREEMLAATEEKLRHAAEAQAELPVRTQELTTARTAYQRLQQEQDQLQAQLREIQTTLGEREAALAQTAEDVTALQTQVTSLTADKEQNSATLAEKEDALAQAQQDISTLQGQVGELTTAKQQVEGKAANLEQQIVAAKAYIEILNREAVHNVDTLREQMKMHEQVSAKIADLHRQLHEETGDDPIEDEDEDVDADMDEGVDGDVGSLFEAQTEVTAKSISPKLEQFLSARGISVQSIPPETKADPVLNSLAQHLGSKYESVKPLYQRIKRNMQQGSEFTLNLKGSPPDVISRICSFANNLHRVAFLEDYHYRRSPHYLLRARPTQKALAQNFFSGEWLERYVLQLARSAVARVAKQVSQQLDVEYITNPRITFNDGQEGELDILLQVNDRIYWIETKSGDYQQHIDKYSMLAQVMNLDADHAIMVLPDIASNHSTNLTNLFHMKVYALHEFEQGMVATLRKELA